MPPCAQVRLPACGRDVRAEQSPQHHDKGGMTDPNAVCRAPARTAARLVARLFCTRPDPVARARSLPFNACVSRRKGRRRPVFNLTSVPKRPESSSTASRRALRPPHSRPRSLDTHPHAHDVCACVRPAALMTSHALAHRPGGSATSSSSSPAWSAFTLSLPPLAPLAPLAPLHLPPTLLLSLILFNCFVSSALVLCLLCVRFERCPWLLGGFALGVSASVWCPALACRVRLRELACACPDSPC